MNFQLLVGDMIPHFQLEFSIENPIGFIFGKLAHDQEVKFFTEEVKF